MRSVVAIGLLTMIALSAWAQQPNSPELSPRVTPAVTPADVADSTEAPKQVSGTLTVPRGTKIPITLRSGISTKTAKTGDAVYAQTAFPITIDNQMAIPAGTYVQGVISNIKRGGRVSGRAEVLFHFTTLIFPSGYTVSLPGSVGGMPGAEKEKIKDPEGTIQREPEKGKDAATVASTAATGATVGAIASRGVGGAGIGAAAGGATGLAIAMLTRGSDVRLESGTTIEMVMGSDLQLQQSRITSRHDPYLHY